MKGLISRWTSGTPIFLAFSNIIQQLLYTTINPSVTTRCVFVST